MEGTWICKKIALLFATELVKGVELKLRSDCPKDFVHDCRCNWSSVTFGTPQGTILGPLIFFIYIKDITNCVSSTVKLYADDTKIYHQTVDPIKDPQLLQIDLSNLMEWARKWQLRFNADKRMCITHTRDKSLTQYMLDNHLKDVKSFKDLGVTISKDLSCYLL